MTKLPHGIKSTDWLVLKTDRGLLHVAPSRRAAVAWCRGDGHDVTGRYAYRGGGAYDYGFRMPGDPEEKGFGCFIATVKAAMAFGYGAEIERGLFDPDADDEE